MSYDPLYDDRVDEPIPEYNKCPDCPYPQPMEGDCRVCLDDATPRFDARQLVPGWATGDF